jgi:hypothetical protein
MALYCFYLGKGMFNKALEKLILNKFLENKHD